MKGFRPLLGNLTRRMDRLIAVSDVSRELFEPHFPGPWQVIPNGIDADLFRPLRAGERRPDGPPRILYVGRLEPRNALDVLLEALVLLRRGGHDVIVQAVGDGPMRERFEAMARDLGVADRVEWLGPRLGDRPRLYREATVFACPCLIASFGVVLLEALASGTPIVATDNIGFRQVIRDGMPASFVPPREPAALAEGITALLDDPDRRREWGERGRRLAEERYAWPNVAAAVERVYEEVLHQNGPGRRPPIRTWRRYPARPPWRPVEIAPASAAAPEGAAP
jgi:glycosyltransferase involved in cell wall biosynthesis